MPEPISKLSGCMKRSYRRKVFVVILKHAMHICTPCMKKEGKHCEKKRRRQPHLESMPISLTQGRLPSCRFRSEVRSALNIRHSFIRWNLSVRCQMICRFMKIPKCYLLRSIRFLQTGEAFRLKISSLLRIIRS